LGRKNVKDKVNNGLEERQPIRSKKEALLLYRELLTRMIRLQELAAKDLERELAWLEQEIKTAEE